MVTVLCPGRTVPLAHALGAQTVIAARDNHDECAQDLQDSGPFDLIVLSGDILPESACMPLLADKGRTCSSLPPKLPSDGWGVLRRALLPTWRRVLSPPALPGVSQVSVPLKYMTGAVENGQV